MKRLTIYYCLLTIVLCSSAFGALRTSVGSGDWDVAGTWDTGVPVNGDTFAIAAGHTVNFNVDQSGFANGMGASSIAATGKLNITDDAGSYYLKMNGDLTVNGTIQAGTSTSVPFTGTFECNFNAGSNSIVVGTTGKLYLYCKEPTYKYVKLNGGEPIAETVLAVDNDVTADIWADGDYIYICDVGSSGMPEAELRVINAGGIAAGTITITAGLTAAKSDGAYVVLRERNIKLTNTTDYAIKIGASATNNYIGAEIYNAGAGCIDGNYGGTGSTVAGTVSGSTTEIFRLYSSTVSASICGGTYGFRYCKNNTISGIFAGLSYGVADYSVNTLGSDGIIAGCNSGFFNTNAITVLGTIDGCIYGLNNCAEILIQGGSILGCGYSFWVTQFLRAYSATFTGVTGDIYVTTSGTAYNTSFDGASEFINYTDTTNRKAYDYFESFDHDGVTNAFKAWCLGGVVTSQTAESIGTLGTVIWYELACEDTTQTYPCFRQYETTVLPGTALEVKGYIRIADGEDLSSVPPELCIVDKFADPLVDSTQSCLDESFPADSTGVTATWQEVNVIWANAGDAPRQVIVRMQAYCDAGGATDVDIVWAIADYQDQISTLYNVLMPVKTTVATADTTTSFTLTAGQATADCYNNMTIMVQDAGDDHWELRSITDWTAGRVITVDTAFGFTPAAADLAYIMATSYGAPVDLSSIPTASENADAVWDEAMAGHTTETTFGGELQTLDPNITLIKYKTDLISLVDTVIKDANDANNFTIEDGTDVNDAFWFMAIIVEDADGNTSKEVRWIDRYDENSGDPNVWVDEPFSFTPAVNDVVHIMGTTYGGYLWRTYRAIQKEKAVINVINNTGTPRTQYIYKEDDYGDGLIPGL